MLREYVHEGVFQAPVVSSYQFYLVYQQHPTRVYNFSKKDVSVCKMHETNQIHNSP